MSGIEAALLEEIANELRVQTDVLKNMRSGTGGEQDSSTNYNAVGKSLKTLGFVVGVASSIIGGAFSTALNLASSGLRTLTSIGTQLFQAQMQLAESTLAGTGTMSSFYDSLSNLPFGLGLLARVLSYHTKVLETNLTTFQKMSQSGATLGGNLDMVRQSAKGMYLSMDEFANVMQANVGVIRMLGGTADEGAKNLIRFNTQLIQGNVGRQLLGMGHTIEEVNTMLASYASIVGGVRDSDFKNQKRMEQSVKSFAVELDLAAQLEGKTRKQKEDELKKAADQAAVQAMLAGMSAENQDKYLQALADAESRGQGAVDLLHSQMLGLPPMTEAAQLFYSMNNQAAEAVRRNADIVKDNTTHQMARAELDRNRAKADAATLQTFERMGQTGRALTFEMDATGQAVRDMAVSAGNAKKIGAETEERGARRIAESREAIARAGESEAGAVAQAAGRAKYQGEWLMNLLYGLFKPLEPILLGVVEAFKYVMTTVIPFATDVLNKIMIPLFEDLFGDISLDDILKPFRDFIAGFTGVAKGLSFDEVRQSLFDFLNPIKNFIGDLINAIDFKAVGEFFADIFNTLGQFARDVFNEMATWDWKAIGGWLKWSLVTVGTFIKDIWGGIKSALTGEVTEGGGFLKNAFEKLGIVIRKIALLVGEIVNRFIDSPLFNTLQEGFMSVAALFGSIVDMLMVLVDSPLGTFIIDQLLAYWNFLAERIVSIIDVIKGVVDVVTGIFQFMTGDFIGGWEKIKAGIASIITGLVDWFIAVPKFVLTRLAIALGFVFEIIKGFAQSLVDGFWYFVDQVQDFFSDGITGAVTKAWEALGKLWDYITDAIKNFGTQLWDKITSSADDEAAKPAETPTASASTTTRTPEAPPTAQATPAPPPARTISRPNVNAGDTGAGAAGAAGAGAETPTAEPPTPSTAAAEEASRNNDRVIEMLNTRINTMNGYLQSIASNTKNAADRLAALETNQLGGRG
jgi:hypothetical protein